jgi:hypothetical protein
MEMKRFEETPPSNKPARKQVSSWALLATCFHAGSLLGSFFEAEDGVDRFLLNVS